eukprot:124224-Pyramimonas_sp.AAC.1
MAVPKAPSTAVAPSEQLATVCDCCTVVITAAHDLRRVPCDAGDWCGLGSAGAASDTQLPLLVEPPREQLRRPHRTARTLWERDDGHAVRRASGHLQHAPVGQGHHGGGRRPV